MRNMWTIAKRELNSYFASPIAYLITAALLVVSGYLFSLILYYSREATMRYMMYNLTTIVMLVGPVLAMRLIAEEKRTGTIELLLTAPVNDWEVVCGKFLASLLLWGGMLLLTFYYPVLLKVFGNPDLGPIAAGYIGLFLVGASFLAIGTLSSTLTSNQIVAAVVGFAFSLMLWLIGAVTDIAGGTLGRVFDYLAMPTHFVDFPKGIIDTKDVIYFLSVIAVALFTATRVLEIRRWK